MSRNMLYFIVGALVVAVIVLGYVVYDQNREPEGFEIQIVQDRLSVQPKKLGPGDGRGPAVTLVGAATLI